MDFAQLIHGFAERNGLGVIEPETDGSYRFVFDDNLPLQCIRASDELIVQSFLGALPADDQQACEEALRLLKINLAQIGSQQAILSLDPDSGELVLFTKLRMRGVSVVQFEEALEDYVNSLEFWVKTVSTQPSHRPVAGMVFP